MIGTIGVLTVLALWADSADAPTSAVPTRETALSNRMIAERRHVCPRLHVASATARAFDDPDLIRCRQWGFVETDVLGAMVRRGDQHDREESEPR